VLPVRLWHSRQWHRETLTGSPSQLRRSWPQAQLAARIFIKATYSNPDRAWKASARHAEFRDRLNFGALAL